MPKSAARREALINQIDLHCGLNDGLKNLSLWQELAQYFPDCIYLGRAWRVILVQSRADLDPAWATAPGHSWSLSLKGIENYLRTGMNYDPVEDKGFWMVRGQIEGISLAHIAAQLKSEGVELKLPIKEDEVILLNLLASQDPQWLNSWQEIQTLNR